ncbi:hypothetical protein MYOV057v1_p0177 [Vibrio phage 184E37.1]|nr:hypothetical protein MYOV057v1_p0177 [Vibrio phage 184E37.1]
MSKDYAGTVYQLAKDEFSELLASSKGSRKLALKGQLKLEKLVVSKGWHFAENYNYINGSEKVNLLCSEGHDCSITPSNLNGGKGCKVCFLNVAKDKFEDAVKFRGWSFGKDYLYKNNTTKVNLICDNGHDRLILPANFKSGYGCSICNGKDKLCAKEGMEVLIKSSGWSLLEGSIYENAKTKLKLLCPVGHKISILPHHFKDNRSCVECNKEFRRDRFEKFVMANNWILPENYLYTNTSTKVTLVCSNGHERTVSPASFEKKVGCISCDMEKSKKVFEDLVKTEGGAFGKDYNYVTTDVKVSLLCGSGHKRSVTPTSFKQGHRCGVCKGNDMGKGKLDLEQEVHARGWKFEHDYTYSGVFEKVHLICPNGHNHSIRPSNFRRGDGCPSCAVYGFNPNKPAYFYIQTLYNRDDVLVGYKIGITNRDPAIRMKEQATKSAFKHKLLSVVFSEDGNYILGIENQVKAELVLSYFSKEDMPDGYKETLPCEDLPTVLRILSK